MKYIPQSDATYVLIGDKAILHFNTGKALKIFKNYCLKLVIINHCRVLPTSRMGYFVSNIIESGNAIIAVNFPI